MNDQTTPRTTVSHRIAEMLYARDSQRMLMTSARTVSQQEELIRLIQDILEHLIADASRSGLSRATVMLQECRMSLDNVSGTLVAAAAIASAVQSIEP